MQSDTRHFETGRLAGFSDGIFAICITLLVLELKLPDSSRTDLHDELRLSLHKLESWAVSFLVIGSIWIMQHNIHAQLRATDTILLWLNLMFLMWISLMAWTTYLIGIYVSDPLAIMIFSGTLGLAGFFLLLEWVYAAHQGQLTRPEIDPQTRRRITTLAARVPIVALISIALAHVHRSVALWCWGLVPLYGAVVRYRTRALSRQKGVAAEI
jgi:uncharacterized membrane protein